MQNAELASQETIQRFNADFDANYAHVVAGQQQEFSVTKYVGSFAKMCSKSREERKPIVLLVTKTNSRECFRHALTNLAKADAAQEMIAEGFIFSGFTIEHPPLE